MEIEDAESSPSDVAKLRITTINYYTFGFDVVTQVLKKHIT